MPGTARSQRDRTDTLAVRHPGAHTDNVAFPFCCLTLRAQKPLPRAYPQALITIGDHLRRRRLDLGLLQREVAERLRTQPCSVTNWELNHTEPELRFVPGIVRFLGYAPWVARASIGERLLAYRRERGLAQSALARLLGIDPGTLSRWERDLRVPTGRYVELTETLLGSSTEQDGEVG